MQTINFKRGDTFRLDGTYMADGVAAALVCAENSLALRTAMAEPDAMTLGDFDGHPAAPTGYGSMLRACAALICDHATDQARAAAAWGIVIQHDRADYSQQPKYNLAPKRAA